jgi:signal transduction histidine kinase
VSRVASRADSSDARRARASASVERQTIELTAVLDSTLEGICMTDADGTLLFANARMDALWRELGLPATGSIWDRIARLATLTSRPEHYIRTFARFAGDPEFEFKDELELPGLARSFCGFTAPVRDAEGRLLGRIFTLRETTSEREAERVKDDFIATVSHEFRTPLTSIQGYLDLVLEGEAGELTDGQRAFLGVARRNAERLLRLVGDLLFVSRLEAQSLALERAEVDLAEIARESVEAAAPLAEERGTTLALHAEQVPPVYGDRARLGQLLDNLLSNAVKFTGRDGRVEVKAERVDGAVLVTVSDTGIGIPAEELERLFERFFRSSNATARSIPGTGLGLTIAKAIAEGHGGSISVRSEEGVGTTVIVGVPVAPAATTETCSRG